MATGAPLRKVGEWVLGETLGEGGFSKVKLGWHEESKRRVALKIMRKDRLALDSAVRRQVEHEIAAMERVKHPNVMRLVEVLWDARYPKKRGPVVDAVVVVLELAAGGELFDFLSFTGCFEEAVARTYFQQLVSGVEACHAQGVAHRDLKPENLLLDESFALKIADFGFSGLFAPQAQKLYTECGTPGYMAPEVARGQDGYDPAAADVWSCGVILFIMLAGFPPFQRPDESDWWFQKLATGKHGLFWQAHSRSAYFSEPTKDFINKVLEPDPQRRITLEAMKKHPWFNGRTIADAALQSEFRRRKATVAEEKARLRSEKRASEGPVVRAELHRYVSGDSASLTGAAAAAAARSLGPPPPFRDDMDVVRNTRLYFNDEPRAVLEALAAAAEQAEGKDIAVDEARFQLKATFFTMAGPVALKARLWTAPKGSPGALLLDVRRQSGDIIQFFSVFSSVEKELLPMAALPEPAAAAATAASSPRAAPPAGRRTPNESDMPLNNPA